MACVGPSHAHTPTHQACSQNVTDFDHEPVYLPRGTQRRTLNYEQDKEQDGQERGPFTSTTPLALRY